MSSDYDMGAHIPADVDAPDKVILGLTFRQTAILAVTAAGLWLGWRWLHPLLPGPVLAVPAIAISAAAVVAALGRRDGLSLDRWLLAALRHARTGHRLAPPAGTGASRADLVHAAARPQVPQPLRLPADAIADDGVIDLGRHGSAVVVAVSTVNFGLRAPAEQAALLGAFGRWLNALPCPAQILITTRPVDLTARTRALTNPGRRPATGVLAAMAVDHTAFLTDLARRADPLSRHVLVVLRDPADASRVRRHADDTAAALARCGATTRVLDAAQAVQVLTHAVDPFRPGGLP